MAKVTSDNFATVKAGVVTAAIGAAGDSWLVRQFPDSAARIANSAIDNWDPEYSQMSREDVEADLLRKVEMSPAIGALMTLILWIILGSLIKAVIVGLLTWWLLDKIENGETLTQLSEMSGINHD